MKHLFLIFIVYSQFAFGQRIVELGAFASLPVGAFAATELQKGGFAEPGWGIALSSRVRTPNVYDRFWVYIHGSWQSNQMNTSALADAFTESIGFKTEVSSSKYAPIVACIGPSHQLIRGKVNLFLNAGIGVLFNNTRAFSVTVYDKNGGIWINEVVSFVNNPAWAYQLGADLSFELIPERLEVSIFGQYTTANQRVDIYLSTNDNAGAFEELRFINTGIKLTLNTFP